MSVYRTIGPLVILNVRILISVMGDSLYLVAMVICGMYDTI